ncbi:short chain dehydrogenase/reductase [Xylariomycetidae sp. FL2044]|nr:short chain dehydrogenase/reductase [Xylariomycetidae sp. FL2044]
MDTLASLCKVLGASIGICTCYKVLDFIWLYSRSSGLGRYLHTTRGEPAWALVTGTTDGIGRALATELASQGFNVVLHGRNEAKLHDVRAELAKKYPSCSFRVLIADCFNCHNEAAYFEEIVAQLEDINLTVLVNNVGGGPRPAFNALQTYTKKQVLDTIHMNAAFPTLLSSSLVPLLEKNGPGLIINIASITDSGLPLVSFYGAAKAFTNVVHLALWRELRMDRRNVEVISHRFGAVTGVSHVREPGTLFRPTASTIAKQILARTGCGRKSVIPYWPHAAQAAVLDLLPTWLSDNILIEVMREERAQQNAVGKDH